MNIQLLKGTFDANDAEKLITDLIRVKIKFHEEKIGMNDDVETIKMRENRIIKLQQEQAKLREFLAKNPNGKLNLEADILIS